MPQPTNKNLVRFADQAHPQLNRILECWNTYRGDSKEVELLTEALRLAHRLKGDASMIGLSGFSHVAFFLEETIQAVFDTGECDERIDHAIHQMVHSLRLYLEALCVDGTDALQSLVRGIIAYRRSSSLPECDDDQEIERLLFMVEPTPVAPSKKESSTSAVEASTLDAFRAEATDHLQVITDHLASGEFDENDLNRIRRSVHSVKGGAGTIGLMPVANLAHEVEDLLEQLCHGKIEFNPHTHALLCQAIDALSDLIEDGHTEVNLTALYSAIAETIGGRVKTSNDSTQMQLRQSLPSTPVSHELDQQTIDEIQDDLSRQVSPELLAVYAEEADDHIKRIYAALNELKTSPDDRNALQDVRRSAHTLKGASGAVGLRVVTKLSHRMEDLLDHLYEGKAVVSIETLTLLLNTVDCLHDLSSDKFDPELIADTVIRLYKAYQIALPSPTVAVAEIAIPVAQKVAAMPAKVTDAESDSDATPKAAAGPEATRKASGGQMLRVPIGRVDELVRTVGELIINRTTFEQRMSDFVRYVEELNPILARLRVVSNELETRYSIDAMRGHRLPGTPHQYGLNSQISVSRFAEFDALEFDRYSDFHLTARAIAEATADVNTVTNELRTLIGDFDSLLARQDRLSRETQDRLMQIRMVPLATLTTRLHRAVRVVATNQNKKVELIIEGENIELDKTVLEELADPLLHLLRNAVDHGVEPSDLRVIKGKPETATIRIRAFYQGTQVVLRVSDDGGGIDHARLAAAAIRGGHLSPAEADSLTAQELLPYIFIPGLSTAEQVSEVSGRGVGMDIVRDKVQKLKGTISVDSELERGTTFTIRLPMTLAVTRALMVKTGGQSFAIPMQAVVQIARLEKHEIDKLGNNPVIRLGDTACPLIRLSEHLGLPSIDSESNMIPVLIIRSGEQQVAVQVEKILAGRDIVVKTLGTHLRKVHGLIGATLLGDGTVVAILDPTTFAGDTDTIGQQFTPTTRRSQSADQTTTVMIVDDSVSVRRVMENLVKSQGWIAVVAKDGVDALEILRLRNIRPDLFLLDIEMPRMDGYELLGSLRASSEFRSSPVVMVTSRAGDKHRQKAFALGATDYLVKPYQDDELIALINRLTAKEVAVK